MEQYTYAKNDRAKYLHTSLSVFFVLILISMIFTLRFNELYGVIFSFFILIFLGLSMKWNVDLRSLFISLVGFFIYKIYGLLYINPITGPDAVRYFDLTKEFTSLTSFYEFAIYELQLLGLLDISSITFYGIFYMPFYKLLSLSDSTSIAIFNSILVILMIFMWAKTFSGFHEDKISDKQKKVFLSTMVLLLFLSPAIGYWSSTFLKDIFSLFLGILSFYLLTKRKYLFFIVAIVIATAIRPYAIGFVFCFWAFYNLRNKWAFLAAIFSSVYVLYEAGLTGLFNTIPMTLRILLVPNPLSLYNWENFFLPTLEGAVIMMGLFLVFISFLRNKQARKVYISFALTLFIYACILTLVGQVAILHRDLEYGFLSAGDDMFRKKLPFMMIIYTAIAYAFAIIKTKTRTFRI